MEGGGTATWHAPDQPGVYDVTLTPAPVSVVWVDDDFDASTPGWGITHSERVYELALNRKDPTDEVANWWAYSMATLEEILKSPLASPLLWYEDIYFEVAQVENF